jgi:hypothetical protein
MLNAIYIKDDKDKIHILSDADLINYNNWYRANIRDTIDISNYSRAAGIVFETLKTSKYVDFPINDTFIRINAGISPKEYLELIEDIENKEKYIQRSKEPTASDRLSIKMIRSIGDILKINLESNVSYRKKFMEYMKNELDDNRIASIMPIIKNAVGEELAEISNLLMDDMRESYAILNNLEYKCFSKDIDPDYVSWLFKVQINARYFSDNKVQMVKEYILLKKTDTMTDDSIIKFNENDGYNSPDIKNLSLLKTISNAEIATLYNRLMTISKGLEFTKYNGFNMLLTLEMLKRGLDVVQSVSSRELTKLFINQKTVWLPSWMHHYEVELSKLGSLIVPNIEENDYVKVLKILTDLGSRVELSNSFKIFIGENKNLIATPKLKFEYLEQFNFTSVNNVRILDNHIFFSKKDNVYEKSVNSHESRFAMMMILMFGDTILGNQVDMGQSPFKLRKDEEGYSRETIRLGIEAISKLNGSRKDRLIDMLSIAMRLKKSNPDSEKLNPRMICEFVEEISNSSLRNATIEKIFGRFEDVIESLHYYEQHRVKEAVDESLLFGISSYEFKEVIKDIDYREIINVSILKSILN